MPADDLESLKKLTERIKAEAQGKGFTDLEQQAQRVLEKLNLQAVISKQLVSVITNKETFLKTVAYAKNAEYTSLVSAKY